MLYIKNNTTDLQKIYIPYTGSTLTNCKFYVTNTINNTEIEPFDDHVAVFEGSYAKLTFTLEETLENGEYEYALKIGTTTLATGLVQIGDFAHNPTEYNKTIEYEQY